jgi:predicted neuraminidase
MMSPCNFCNSSNVGNFSFDRVVGCLLLAMALLSSARAESTIPGCIKSEFIYETAPFPECHASTIVETPTGIVASWFGGTREKHPDVGIWLSRLVDDKWTTPVEVANGVESPTKREPCWNPVLFQVPGGPLQLYYKVGPSPSAWWGMVRSSTDGGQSWSESKRLPDKILGPIKNKPVMLNDGRMISGSSTEDDGWRVHIESTNNLGFSWNRTPPLTGKDNIQAIQPTILTYPEKRVQILCRGKGTGRIVEAWSKDNGRTWSELTTIDLPNPNSGIDATTLADGRQLLVYNHTPRGRSPLNVAVSKDGANWLAAAVLENTEGEYSYPAVIQSSDGLVHVTYTWKRKRIRHVVLDPAKLESKEIVKGEWPKG